MMNRRWVTSMLLLAGFLAGWTTARAQAPEAAVGDWSALSVGGSVNASRLQYGQHMVMGACGGRPGRILNLSARRCHLRWTCVFAAFPCANSRRVVSYSSPLA